MTYPTVDDAYARQKLANAFNREADRMLAVAARFPDAPQQDIGAAAKLFKGEAGEIEQGTDTGRALFADFVQHAAQNGIAFDDAVKMKLDSVMREPRPPGL
jgi:hypothetical protein